MAQVTRSVIVKAPVESVYALWANFESFPQFMKYIESVESTGPQTSRWIMSGPLGFKVDWTAEMTRNETDKRIAWNTKDNGGVITTSGQVLFNDLPQDETEITVTVHYTAPGGKAGELFANLFGNPDKRLEEDLRHFKAFAEGMTSRTSSGHR
jgi:uncharacterized membrane protein